MAHAVSGLSADHEVSSLQGRCWDGETVVLVVDSSALVLGSESMELALSHGFAAAASAASEVQLVELRVIVRCSSVIEKGKKRTNEGSGAKSSALIEGEEEHAHGWTWSEAEMDLFLRCVDRCQQRIFPPLDNLQYLGAGSPAFSTTAPEKQVVFRVRPTVAYEPRVRSAWPVKNDKHHCLDRESSSSMRMRAMHHQPHHLVDGESRLRYQVSSPSPSSWMSIQDGEGAAAGGSAAHSDGELWGLARDAHRRYLVEQQQLLHLHDQAQPERKPLQSAHSPVQDGDVVEEEEGSMSGGEACAGSGSDTDSEQRRERLHRLRANAFFAVSSNGDTMMHQSSRRKDSAIMMSRFLEEEEEEQGNAQRMDAALSSFQWRCARWVAERCINEQSWAKPAAIIRSVAGTAGTSSSGSRQDRRRFAPPQTSSAKKPSAFIPSAADVLEAARQQSSRRFLHADARGIECELCMIGYTDRYAYLAAASSKGIVKKPKDHVGIRDGEGKENEDAVESWTVVARVPRPAALFDEDGAILLPDAQEEGEGEGEGDPAGRGRKRLRADHHDDHIIKANKPTRGHPAGYPNATERGQRAAWQSRVSEPPLENLDEVLGHDSRRGFVTLPPFQRRVKLTVRAHTVSCCCHSSSSIEGAAYKDPNRANPTARCTPLSVGLVLSDCFVISLQCVEGSNVSASTGTMKSPAFPAVNTLSDVMELIRSSCQRYVRTSAVLFAKLSSSSSSTIRTDCHRNKSGLNASEPGAPGPGSEENGNADADADGRGQNVENTNEAATTTGAQCSAAEQLAARKAAMVQQADLLYQRMNDTTSVYFRKARQGKRDQGLLVPLIRTCRDVAGLTEGPTVEFKYSLSHHTSRLDGRSDNDNGEEEQQQKHHKKGVAPTTATTERLRHTLAAMANTHGGVVLVGVSDSGAVVGHPPGQVTQAMRLGGFCPAMVKDSVQMRELPVVKIQGTNPYATATNSSSVLAANWWKTGQMIAPQSASTSKHKKIPGDEEQAKVITVLTVQKGQAPFYGVSRAALAYQRGCASTTPMPVWCMTLRLFPFLQ